MGFTQQGVRNGNEAWPPRHIALVVVVRGAGHRLLLAAGITALLAGAPVAAQTLDDELAGLLSAYPQLDASRADIAAANDAVDRASPERPFGGFPIFHRPLADYSTSGTLSQPSSCETMSVC